MCPSCKTGNILEASRTQNVAKLCEGSDDTACLKPCFCVNLHYYDNISASDIFSLFLSFERGASGNGLIAFWQRRKFKICNHTQIHVYLSRLSYFILSATSRPLQDPLQTDVCTDLKMHVLRPHPTPQL